MKIFLDDTRPVPEGFIGARNSAEFMACIERAHEDGEKIETIAFDNDLGEETEGRHLLAWLGERYPEDILEATITIHTDNPVAREIMEGYIASSREHPDDFREASKRPNPWGERTVS